MVLASRVSGHAEEKIEQMYREACSDDGGLMFAEEPPAEDEVLNPDSTDNVGEGQGSEGGGDQGGEGEVEQLLSTIHAEADWARKTEAEEQDSVNEMIEESKALELEFGKMPNKEEMLGMLDEPADPEKPEIASMNKLPSSLLEAVHEPGDLFNALFRLSLRLRSGPGGCDRSFVPNPKNARKASRKLNWYQPLVAAIDFFLTNLCILTLGVAHTEFGKPFVDLGWILMDFVRFC